MSAEPVEKTLAASLTDRDMEAAACAAKEQRLQDIDALVHMGSIRELKIYILKIKCTTAS